MAVGRHRRARAARQCDRRLARHHLVPRPAGLARVGLRNRCIPQPVVRCAGRAPVAGAALLLRDDALGQWLTGIGGLPLEGGGDSALALDGIAGGVNAVVTARVAAATGAVVVGEGLLGLPEMV